MKKLKARLISQRGFNFTSVFVILVLAISFAVLAFEGALQVQYYLVWLFSCLCMIGIIATRLSQTVKLTEIVKSRLVQTLSVFSSEEETAGSSRSASAEEKPCLEVLIKRSLNPRLEVVESLDKVCKIAAQSIEEAHNEEDEQHRFITFYGSASLSTVDPSRRRFGWRRRGVVKEEQEVDEDVQTPEQIYAGALEAAASDQVRIRRYIKLLSLDEYKMRGTAFRREYLEWLKSQMHQLNRNQNYRLTDVVRAPQWGSNVARIVTHRRLLELVGDGEAGVLIIGEDLAEAMRRHARISVLGSEKSANLPCHYGQSKPWRDLPGNWSNIADFSNNVVGIIEEAYAALEGEAEH